MGKKLYVGNLSYTVDSSELEQLFGQHGTVESAQIISDRDTGRSKGFGFVEMANDAEAQAAIAALNGQEHGEAGGGADRGDEPDFGPLVYAVRRKLVHDHAGDRVADPHADAVDEEAEQRLGRAADGGGGFVVGVDEAGGEEEVEADAVQ